MINKVSLFFATVVFAAGMVFAGCDKDKGNNNGAVGGSSFIDGNTITVSVSDVGDAVDEVHLVSYTKEDEVILATAEFSNNSFTLELPASVAAENTFLFSKGAPEGINISNANVKVCMPDIEAYKNSNYIADFTYENYDGDNQTDVTIWYVDGDLTITGAYTDKSNIQFNCNLKKGWNYVATVYNGKNSDGIDTYEILTTIPEGVKWVFDSDNYKGASFSLRSAGRKALFDSLK
ncbi:MAG: hypothetical protein LBV41_08335 [Cytophagaceae bacterium]|jgi:hypothetical protein|nr:hypothetical protein [Cytophagaceae bacterium]